WRRFRLGQCNTEMSAVKSACTKTWPFLLVLFPASNRKPRRKWRERPNVDEGFTQADLRIPSVRKRSTRGSAPVWLVREAPTDDVKLQQLAGHLHADLFITKFRKTFCRDERNADLVLILWLTVRYDHCDRRSTGSNGGWPHLAGKISRPDSAPSM